MLKGPVRASRVPGSGRSPDLAKRETGGPRGHLTQSYRRSVQLTFGETFQTASPLLQSRLGEGPPFSGSPVPGHCSHR